MSKLGQRYQSNKGVNCACGAPAAVLGQCRRCYSLARYRDKRAGLPPPCAAPIFGPRKPTKPLCKVEGCLHRQVNQRLCQAHLDEQKRASRTGKSRRRTQAKRVKSKGATLQDLEQLRSLQQGKCAICLVQLQPGTMGPWAECLDHCHKSISPRGLLCQACNISIGKYETFQREAGLRLEPYDRYLSSTPYQEVLLRRLALD